MFPLILAVIPLSFFRNLNMINNFVPVILVYTVTQLPFATWMLRSYFDSILRDLDEAAKVDGAAPLRTFFQIICRWPFLASLPWRFSRSSFLITSSSSRAYFFVTRIG